jgi:zinc protease
MSPRARRSPRQLFAVLLAAALPACSSAAPAATRAPVEARPWEHERSDVPVDPRIRFGQLDNGLRWAWAANPEPKERCYLRLHVDVGSLAEEPDELGMAHFLEHMAFNGSRNFEPGTLIEWFQEHGMAFGADTNASTGFSETIYQIDLPVSDEADLREGLAVLRDFADGLLLEPEEVEAEKGVIDGEERERDSAGFRVLRRQLETVFAGTRLGERLPIGRPEVRAAFSADSVRAFYERWYRPEHMTLIVVGDLGPLDPVPLFREAFDDLSVPEEPLRREPPAGVPERFDSVVAIHEPEIPSVALSIQRLRPWKDEPYTEAELLEDIPLSYARRMLNLRFSELAKQESAPFLGASVRSAEALRVFDGEGLQIVCAPERWQEALASCEQELRRALEHGFQPAELAEVVADGLRSLDEAVEREPTASSRALLRRLLTAAEERYVPADAATRRSLLRPAIEALDPEVCHAALREAWEQGELSIQVTGNLDLGPDAEGELLAAWEASRSVPVEVGELIAADTFAYASSADETGEIVSREHVEDLDAHLLRFANGVAINVKATEFKENQILVQARLGEGQLSLPVDEAVLGFVANEVFNGGGLEAHSEDDLRRLTAGRQVGVGFGTGPDAFTLGGSTTAEDLLLQCELLCAYLEHPGWREEGLVQFRRRLPLLFESLDHQHQGPLLREFLPALHGDDPRFGLPTQQDMEAASLAEIREWLAPQLAQAPLEVTLVGDLDVERTVEIAAATFGRLPPRRELLPWDERRQAPPVAAGLDVDTTIETQIPKSLVMIVFPATDGIEMRRRRLFNVLSIVVNDRLRIEVRERLGAAYSPGAGVDVSSVHPGVGMLMIQAMSDPETVDTLVEACLGVADSLAGEGVTDEELARLREPILKQRRDAKRTNGYWVEVLSEAQLRPESLDEARAGDAFYESVGSDDLSPLAAEYLRRERASLLVVRPSGDS